MEMPITVNNITFEEGETLHTKCLLGGKCGDMVVVRPCAEEFENKTFLGVLLGEIALSVGASFNKENGELKIGRYMHNPAILIPERNAIVYGCGSWWKRITRKEQLKKITDEDINNVWYLKALNQIVGRSR